MPETLPNFGPTATCNATFTAPRRSRLSARPARPGSPFGSWRQQFDWAVLEWNRDNVFEHPALRISGWRSERRHAFLPGDALQLHSPRFHLVSQVDWPYLRIWAEIGNAEVDYRVPLKDHATAVGLYVAPTVQFQLQGTITSGDYIELSWLDQHFNYQVTGSDTLASAINSLAYAITSNQSTGLVTATASANAITLTYLGAADERQPRRRVWHGARGGHGSWAPAFGLFSGGQSPAAWQVNLNFQVCLTIPGQPSQP